MAKPKTRLLFFDVIKILAIVLIILRHIATVQPSYLHNTTLFTDPYGVPGLIYADVGGWGVTLFLITSGALLEYTYGSKLLDKFNYIGFMLKRISRIYPAYWLSLILAFIYYPYFNYMMITSYTYFPYDELVISLTGFHAFIGGFGGYLSQVGWYVGVIIVFYLSYPLVSKLLRKHGLKMMIAITLFSLIVAKIMNDYYPDPHYWTGPAINYWFPPSRLYQFALGIYIVQAKLYPQIENKFKVIRFVSDLTFPMFLVNFILINTFVMFSDKYYLNLFIYIFAVITFSYGFNMFDSFLLDVYRKLMVIRNKNLIKRGKIESIE